MFSLIKTLQAIVVNASLTNKILKKFILMWHRNRNENIYNPISRKNMYIFFKNSCTFMNVFQESYYGDGDAR